MSTRRRSRSGLRKWWRRHEERIEEIAAMFVVILASLFWTTLILRAVEAIKVLIAK